LCDEVKTAPRQQLPKQPAGVRRAVGEDVLRKPHEGQARGLGGAEPRLHGLFLERQWPAGVRNEEQIC
jgi:hypothetical protein